MRFSRTAAARRITALAILAMGLVLAAAVWQKTRKPRGYVLHNLATMYDPLGVHCQAAVDTGAIVGGSVVVDDRPAPIDIRVYIYRETDLQMVFDSHGDPRSFKTCGVAPGLYTLALEYPPNDRYLLGHIEVKPALAARTIFTVEDR